MKEVLSVIILIFMVMSCQTPSMKDRDKIKDAVLDQVSIYPKSTLTDIYKSFYQDECGPGHLLGDTAAAREYFISELNEMISRGRHTAEPCGIGKQFVRVPMDLVKDSIIDPGTFFNTFLASAKAFSTPELEQWKKKWEDILEVVVSMHLDLPGFEEDRQKLEDLLNQGRPVVHHSQAYTDHYDPHYRIMTRQQWIQIRPGRQ